MALPTIGETLAGKYRIDRVIGEGGMGVVFEAFHLRMQQKVAIKMLRPDVLGNRTVAGRFEREARAAAKIQGPNVAKVLDVDTAEGNPYLVIEYLDGHDLAKELEQRVRLPIAEAVGYVLEACIPIGQAHGQGIIHRDLKPSNLFLATVDGKRCLKLLDFGISKFVVETGAKLTAGAEALGTPEYMSPEQIRQTANVDHRADIWSLGVILYELLTGTVPFEGAASAVIAAVMVDAISPVRSLRRDVPEALDEVIMRALEKDPDRRFQNVRELASALEPFAVETAVKKGIIESIPPPALPAAEAQTGARRRTTLRTWASTHPPAIKRGISMWLIVLVVTVGGAIAGGAFWVRRGKAHVRRESVAAALPVRPPPAETQNAANGIAVPQPTQTTVTASTVAPADSAKSKMSRPAGFHPQPGRASPTATATTATMSAPATSANMFDQRF